jgi:catechol 2,3-dioxygenase-like lactoylglutathione lyase family enzyme
VFHAAVNVAGKLEEARAFDMELLGLPEVPVDVPGIDASNLPVFWVEQESVQMHAIGIVPATDGQTETAARAGKGPNAINHHISWLVEDIEAALAALEAAGKRVEAVGTGRKKVIWTVDPASNTVEFQQDPNF